MLVRLAEAGTGGDANDFAGALICRQVYPENLTNR